MRVPGPIRRSSDMPVQRAVSDAGRIIREKRFYPTLNKNNSILGCWIFSIITFYCHKYLEERSTNADTRANPPFFSCARSKSGP